jgi:uncharacterized protein (TIGR03643 family)
MNHCTTAKPAGKPSPSPTPTSAWANQRPRSDLKTEPIGPQGTPPLAKKIETFMTDPETNELDRGQIDRIIMMAWEDRTSFDAIRDQFGLSPGDVIKLMRREMTANSFKMWRKRTHGRTTKHEAKFAETNAGDQPRRFRAKSQRG